MKRKRVRAAAPVADIQKIVGDLADALHRLVAAVAAPKSAAAPFMAEPAEAKAGPGRARKARKARRTAAPMTPAKRKALQMQAHYMVAIRSLSVAEKAKVKELREKKGVEAAIRFAGKFAKKRSGR